MTGHVAAAVAVHGGDWQGALIVLTVLLLILAAGYGEDFLLSWRTARDVLDEATETWGPGTDDPIPFTLAAGAARVVDEDSLHGVLVSWSQAAAGIEIDHAVCEGPFCDRVICCCPTGVCAGFVEQACGHHTLLCDECRTECTDCRLDARDDAGFAS